LEQQSKLKDAVLPTRSLSIRNQSRVTNKVSPYDSDADYSNLSKSDSIGQFYQVQQSSIVNFGEIK
jgi:hypothetical protein